MTTQEKVTHHFDAVGRDGTYVGYYDVEDTLTTHDFLTRMWRVEELLDPWVKAGARVLDLGCGPGPMVDWVCRRGASYVGLDTAPGMLANIERKYRDTELWDRIEVRVGSCEEIPYPNAHFDAVIAMGLLEYMDDMGPTCDDIARVTKPGGLVVLTIPNRTSMNRFLMRNTGFITGIYQGVRRMLGLRVLPGADIPHAQLRPAQLDGLMLQRRFTRRGGAFYDYKLVPYPLTRFASGLAFAINKRVENRLPGVFANGYIGLYEKRERTGH
jgi:ubiquinone/menaquinone biosynthesis C-methylase UbiE